MFQLIRSDIERYNGDDRHLLKGAFKAAYSHPSFVGVIWYRMGHHAWTHRANPIYKLLLVINRILYPFIRIYSGLELAPKTQIGPGLYIAHFGPTVIHPDVIAGRNLTLMQGVTIGNRNGIPCIGNDVSIGTDAKVLGEIRLGDHVTVGAGAVVTKDVPEGYTVVGIPARPVWIKEEAPSHGESIK